MNKNTRKLACVGIAVTSIIAAPALAKVPTVPKAPTVTISATLGTPGWTTAGVIDSFQHDTAGVIPRSSVAPSSSLLFGLGDVVKKGASPLSADKSNQYAQLLPGGAFTFLDFEASQAVHTFSFSLALSSNSNFNLFVVNAAGQFVDYTRNTLMPGLSGSSVAQITINQDASSYIRQILFVDTAGTTSVDNIATAAPEPGTWMMMILGFGLIGGFMRSSYRSSGRNIARTNELLATI